MNKTSKTKKILIIVLICILMIGTGIGIFVAMSIKKDKVGENGELVYVVDRYADEYGSFTVKINQNGDVFDVSVYVDGEQYVDYELVYNKDTNVFTSEDDVVLDGVELVDGCEIVKATLKNDDAGLVSKDEFKPVGMNYGKNFVIETTENGDEYKVVYLDLGGKNEGNVVADNSGKDKDKDKDTTEVTTEEKTTAEKKTEDEKEEIEDNGRDESGEKPDNSNGYNNTPSNPNNGNSENGNSGNNTGGNNVNTGNNTGNNGGGNTTQTPSTEAPSTEAPSTEYVCEHDWVEEMGTRNVFSHCVQVCKYCGFEALTVQEIGHHVMGCGGIWTHEDLKDADPYVYNLRIGRPRGASYKSEERYTTETYVVGYRCKKCGEFKYAD